MKKQKKRQIEEKFIDSKVDIISQKKVSEELKLQEVEDWEALLDDVQEPSIP